MAFDDSPSDSSSRRRRRTTTLTTNATDAEKGLAAHIRDIYTCERARYETLCSGKRSGYQAPSFYDGRSARRIDATEVCKAVPDVWLTLAREFVSRGIDPQTYIASQFRWLEPRQRIIEPPRLFDDTCLLRWEKLRDSRGQELEIALRVQMAIARTRMSYLQTFGGLSGPASHRNTLLDTSLELSALFRLCLLRSLPQPELRKLAERFEAEAAIQFVRDSADYLAHWQAILPEGYQREAQRIYDWMFTTTRRRGEAADEV